MPHETSDFISGNDQVFTHQPTYHSVDREILIRALSAAEEAKDYAVEMLANHDCNFGRKLKRHRMMAEQFEKSIEQSARVQAELRQALGWPQRQPAEDTARKALEEIADSLGIYHSGLSSDELAGCIARENARQ